MTLLLISSVCFCLLRLMFFTLRREGLADTELANAQVGTIRLKLLKIGARIAYSVRRIVIHLAGGYPFKDIFVHILGCFSPTVGTGSERL